MIFEVLWTVYYQRAGSLFIDATVSHYWASLAISSLGRFFPNIYSIPILALSSAFRLLTLPLLLHLFCFIFSASCLLLYHSCFFRLALSPFYSFLASSTLLVPPAIFLALSGLHLFSRFFVLEWSIPLFFPYLAWLHAAFLLFFLASFLSFLLWFSYSLCLLSCSFSSLRV